MDTPFVLPDWLNTGQNKEKQSLAPATQAEASITKAAQGHLLPFQFPQYFEQVLDKICSGQSLVSAMADDVREFDRAQFVRWINRDSQRQARYHEAQEIGAEVIAGEMISIADAENSLEDVQRSTLRINTRKYLLGVWNRKRYGETKQLEVNTTISVAKALEQAHARLQDLSTVIDVETKDVSSNE